jgi:thiamine monophosphate synthase
MELHIDIEGCYFVTNDGGCSDNFNDVEAAEEALDNGTLRIN